MVIITRRFEFSAAHRYWRDDWSREQNERTFGTYSSPYGHGHNYTLDVSVQGPIDPITGMVINITDLKAIVGDVLEGFDHKHLNLDTPYFKEALPTTENIVRVLWDLITPRLPDSVSLAKLRLAEMNDLWAEYTGEDQTSFSRSYIFSAAHRLNATSLSQSENQAIYGKCNNPNGHGHNYTVEVTVAGPVDANTGMLIDLGQMDARVRTVLSQLDLHHIDREVAAFAEQPSTAENITLFLWQELAPRFAGQLKHVRVWETNRNVFDYSGQTVLPGAR